MAAETVVELCYLPPINSKANSFVCPYRVPKLGSYASPVKLPMENKYAVYEQRGRQVHLREGQFSSTGLMSQTWTRTYRWAESWPRPLQQFIRETSNEANAKTYLPDYSFDHYRKRVEVTLASLTAEYNSYLTTLVHNQRSAGYVPFWKGIVLVQRIFATRPHVECQVYRCYCQRFLDHWLAVRDMRKTGRRSSFTVARSRTARNITRPSRSAQRPSRRPIAALRRRSRHQVLSETSDGDDDAMDGWDVAVDEIVDDVLFSPDDDLDSLDSFEAEERLYELEMGEEDVLLSGDSPLLLESPPPPPPRFTLDAMIEEEDDSPDPEITMAQGEVERPAIIVPEKPKPVRPPKLQPQKPSPVPQTPPANTSFRKPSKRAIELYTNEPLVRAPPVSARQPTLSPEEVVEEDEEEDYEIIVAPRTPTPTPPPTPPKDPTPPPTPRPRPPPPKTKPPPPKRQRPGGGEKMRKLLAVRTKLTVMRVIKPAHVEEEDDEEDDLDWLAQFKIIMETNKDLFKIAFRQYDSHQKGFLYPDELVKSLHAANVNLGAHEMKYLNRVLELIDRPEGATTNLQTFSIIAALSDRIASVDDYLKKYLMGIDYRSLELKSFKAKWLWRICVDPVTQQIPLDNVVMLLRAGGVSMPHEQNALEKLRERGVTKFDLLDFILYLPFFIMVHRSVCDNPLDDSRDK